MTTTEYVLAPISPDRADTLRSNGGEVYVADQQPGFPCRQCLRDAEIGEELILVSHDPFTGDSPYRSASPIFLHRKPCRPPTDAVELPSQLTVRQLSVRSFDRQEMMIDAAVIEGCDLATTIERFLARDDSHTLHVHNATRGCWATNITRSSSRQASHTGEVV